MAAKNLIFSRLTTFSGGSGEVNSVLQIKTIGAVLTVYYLWYHA
jgi:hypothetical protein